MVCLENCCEMWRKLSTKTKTALLRTQISCMQWPLSRKVAACTPRNHTATVDVDRLSRVVSLVLFLWVCSCGSFFGSSGFICTSLKREMNSIKYTKYGKSIICLCAQILISSAHLSLLFLYFCGVHNSTTDPPNYITSKIGFKIQYQIATK